MIQKGSLANMVCSFRNSPYDLVLLLPKKVPVKISNVPSPPPAPNNKEKKEAAATEKSGEIKINKNGCNSEQSGELRRQSRQCHQRLPAGGVRGPGVPIGEAAAGDRGAGGGEVEPQERQQGHVVGHVGVAPASLRPRRVRPPLGPHLGLQAQGHLLRG